MDENVQITIKTEKNEMKVQNRLEFGGVIASEKAIFTPNKATGPTPGQDKAKQKKEIEEIQEVTSGQKKPSEGQTLTQLLDSYKGPAGS